MTQSHDAPHPDLVIERLVDLAEDDLDLVAEAIARNTVEISGSPEVDIPAVENWIRRAIDARCFDDLPTAVGVKSKTHHRRSS